MRNFFIGVAIWMAACSGNDERATTLNDANKKFQDGDFENALAVYVDLIPNEGSKARVGAGWCALYLNDFSGAEEYFSAASSDSILDGYAGWAFALWALDRSAEVIPRIEWVLVKDPNFQFSLKPDIEASQLKWVQASSYLQIGNYPECLAWIQKLDPSFSVDVTDANAPSLLLSKLQLLGSAAVLKLGNVNPTRL